MGGSNVILFLFFPHKASLLQHFYDIHLSVPTVPHILSSVFWESPYIFSQLQISDETQQVARW